MGYFSKTSTCIFPKRMEHRAAWWNDRPKDKGDYTNFFREIDFNFVEKLKKDLFESS